MNPNSINYKFLFARQLTTLVICLAIGGSFGCKRSKSASGVAMVSGQSNGCTFEYPSNHFKSWKSKREPRLTIQENGTDIPLGIAPARTKIIIGIKASGLHPASDLKTVGDAEIQFIPLQDSTVPDFKAAYPDLWKSADEIRLILKSGVPRVKARAYLPDWDCVDIGQTIHAKAEVVKGAWCNGVQFITQYTQEETGIDNQGLRYVFQGLSNDGKYYISASIPIAHPSLPQQAPYLDQNPGEPNDHYSERVNQHYLNVEEMLNKQSGNSFQPSLDTLQSLIQSCKASSH